MNKLQLPHAKLFYAVGEAYRKRLIDETEKRILKGTLITNLEKIINDNVEVFEVLDQSDVEETLIEKLISLVRIEEPEVETEPQIANEEVVPNPNEE